MSETWNVEEALKRRDVLKQGHFLLSSGRHSRQYMQCAQLLQHPEEAEEAGKALAALFHGEAVDVVVGPALGGVIIAHETARALGVRCIFTERKEGEMTIRRGFSVQPGERVVIIEDVVTTGGSVNEVIRLAKEAGATLVGVGSIVDRSGGGNPFDVPFRSLLELKIESYAPKECPLCKEGIPAVKPGSREIVKTG
ncbi:orotate phosphoribosyltransferase [Marinithermofilum abyssi]|uniref:Orotate phosphoribosyltransferase n=1 Tax=Marinithermofilum abyssi TaxID=1571185 RepID=A0A8J2VD50_9BACL|nr:orotate phosphoribosyltransferase [Marinithermofilum abyssi]GGE22293.1 orotate phosphoribosyltransferase [Marinithermofilum abyssi]